MVLIGTIAMACRDVPARPMSGASGQTAAEGTDARDGSAPALPRPLPDAQQRIVGQRVSLTVRGHDIANDVAFWAEDGGRPLLVVMSRDVRNAAQQQQGLPSMHTVDASRPGAPVVITGTVERLPNPEAMYSWRLTSADRANVARLGVYLRAESVQTAPASSGF